MVIYDYRASRDRDGTEGGEGVKKRRKSRLAWALVFPDDLVEKVRRRIFCQKGGILDIEDRRGKFLKEIKRSGDRRGGNGNGQTVIRNVALGKGRWVKNDGYRDVIREGKVKLGTNGSLC